MFDKFVNKINYKNVDNIFESKTLMLEHLKEKNESAFVYLLNKIFSRVVESVETGLADYGYWVLPDGKEIQVDGFQEHESALSATPFKTSRDALENGYARLITYGGEFLVEIERSLTRSQFATISALLQDHNAFTSYSVFSIATLNEPYKAVYDYRQFINLLRSNIENRVQPSKDVVESFFRTGIEKIDKTVFNIERMNPTLFSTLVSQSKNKTKIFESISTKTALKARNDLVKLAKKYTDSANIVPLSNFESFEDSDFITLKLSIFDKNSKALNALNDKMIHSLKKDGWHYKNAIFKKNDVEINFHPIKRVFKTGAYQNREIPQLGIEIVGLKKQKII